MGLARICNEAQEDHRNCEQKKKKGKLAITPIIPSTIPSRECGPGLQHVLKHRSPFDSNLKHRAGVLAIHRAEVPHPSHRANFRRPVRIRTVWGPGLRG